MTELRQDAEIDRVMPWEAEKGEWQKTGGVVIAMQGVNLRVEAAAEGNTQSHS